MKADLILCAAFAVIAFGIWVGLRLAKSTRLWPAALLIVTAPLNRSSSGAGLNLSLFRIALGVVVVAYAFDLARGRLRVPRSVALPFVIYTGLVVLQLISVAFVTSNHTLAYRFLGQYAGGLLAAFMLTRYVAHEDLRRVVALYGAGAVLPLIAAASRVFSVRYGGEAGDLAGLSAVPEHTGSFLVGGTQRLNATFTDPNHFGFYAGSVLVVLAGAIFRMLFLDKRLDGRLALSYLLMALGLAIALIGTYSRSAWVLAAVALCVFLALAGRALWTRRRVVVVSAVALIVVGAMSPAIVTRLGAAERGNAISTHEHERTMRIALKLAASHPLVGVGLGGYGHYAGQPAGVSSAHSTFLTVAAELGIPGIALLIAAITATAVAGVQTARRAPPDKRVLLAGFVAAFIGLTVSNFFYEVWANEFQWVLFGLVVAITSQRQVALRLARIGRSTLASQPVANPSDQPVASSSEEGSRAIARERTGRVLPLATGALALVLIVTVVVAREKPSFAPVAGRQPPGAEAPIPLAAFEANDTYGTGLTRVVPSPVASLSESLGDKWRELRGPYGRAQVLPSGHKSAYFEVSLVVFSSRGAARLELVTSAGQRRVEAVKAGVSVVGFGPLLVPPRDRVGLSFASASPNGLSGGPPLVLSPLETQYLPAGQWVTGSAAVAEIGPDGLRGISLPTESTTRFAITPGIHGPSKMVVHGASIGGAVSITVVAGNETHSTPMSSTQSVVEIGPFSQATELITLSVAAKGNPHGSVFVEDLRFVAAHAGAR